MQKKLQITAEIKFSVTEMLIFLGLGILEAGSKTHVTTKKNDFSKEHYWIMRLQRRPTL